MNALLHAYAAVGANPVCLFAGLCSAISGAVVLACSREALETSSR